MAHGDFTGIIPAAVFGKFNLQALLPRIPGSQDLPVVNVQAVAAGRIGGFSPFHFFFSGNLKYSIICPALSITIAFF